MDKAATSPASGAAPAHVEPNLTGRTLGDFQLLRRLGIGGMGQVYLAEQVSLKRKVALKIMRAELAANVAALQRFKAEAEAVARVTHANIVQVYAIGENDGLHYMALEYVDGKNLREYLARKGPPELPLALSIMRQVAAALQRAGELGIIHRDIKPDNILLTRKGEVKVADFGLVRCFTGEQGGVNLTQSGVTLGTPLYMSPEQVQGKELDPRSDIYSFGVTCYHLLAGQPPFHGATAFEVALQHVQAIPKPLHTVRPDLPAELCAFVDKMMAKSPDDRFQTSRDVLKELNRLRETAVGTATGRFSHIDLKGLPTNSDLVNTVAATSTPPKSVRTLPISPTRGVRVKARRRWKIWLAASLLVALMAGAGLGLVARPRTLPPQAVLSTAPFPALTPPAPAAAAPAVLPDKEQFLLDQFADYAKPGGFDRLRLGVGCCIELCTFYFERREFDKAEAFFNRIKSDHNDVKPYLMIACLGHAVVLSEQGKARESNQAFLECKRHMDGHKFEVLLIQFDSPLRIYVAKAIDRNDKSDPIPSALELLRNPPTPYKMARQRFYGNDRPANKEK